MIEVTKNTLEAGIKTTKEKLKKNGRLAMQRGMSTVRSAVIPNVPVKTSRLKNSIQDDVSAGNKDSINKIEEKETEIVGTLGTNVPYAQPLEFGFDAYVMKPKNKKALFWPGAAHPVKSVNMPARAGKFFFTNGFNSAKDAVLKVMANTLKF